MFRSTRLFPLVMVAAVALFAGAGPALAGVPGAPDQVPAATLLAPFFETGVDREAFPQDTLLVVTNESDQPVRVHYEVWDVDSDLSGIFDTVLLPARGTLSLSMRDLIDNAPQAAQDELLDGPDFYRGFVTFDVVTEETEETPFSGTYPFAGDNVLTGWSYFTRLEEGSANGLAMVHLEWHDETLEDDVLLGFYAGSSRVEEIDTDSRGCAASLVQDGTCALDEEADVDEMIFRVFLNPELNGQTRIVVFTFDPLQPGGPSETCVEEEVPCATEYSFRRFSENGTLLVNATIRLDNVVNVIEVDGTSNGWVSIRGIPSVGRDLQVYGFVFNQAKPADLSLNWDAIFEATIDP